MRRGRLALGAGFALVAACSGICLGPTAIHKMQTKRGEWAIAAIVLPHAQVIESWSKFGVFWPPSSNHCDSGLWVLVSSELPPEAFVAQEGTIRIPSPFFPFESYEAPWKELLDVWLVEPDGLFFVSEEGSIARAEPYEGDGFYLESFEFREMQERSLVYPRSPGERRYVLRTVAVTHDPPDFWDPACH